MAEPKTPDSREETAEARPFVAPCRTLSWRAPLRWLRAGWDDLRHAWPLSLGYGLVILGLSWLTAGLGWTLGGYALLLTLVGGFLLLAPALALSLYSISCQLEAGIRPRLGYCLQEGRRNLRNEALFALVLLIVFLLWARAGSVVHIFFPVQADAGWRAMATFLGIGSLVGALFAGLVFAASAFALPMMLDLKIDAITAVLTSAHAVLHNKPAMVFWAGCILVLTACGMATAFIGLAVVVPWLGHATWHAYRDTILTAGWPRNRLAHEGALSVSRA